MAEALLAQDPHRLQSQAVARDESLVPFALHAFQHRKRTRMTFVLLNHSGN